MLFVSSCSSAAQARHGAASPAHAAPAAGPQTSTAEMLASEPGAVEMDSSAVVVTSSADGAPVAREEASNAPRAVPTAARAGQDGAGSAAGSAGQPSQAVQRAGKRSGAKKQEALVVEGWLVVMVESVAAAAEDVRAQVEGAGGRITSERISGGTGSVQGHLEIKLPPAEVEAFLAWLDEHTEIRSKRIQSTDVSRQLFDYRIALQNLEHTLQRMHALLDREGLSMQEILSIENQLTRLRGQIERIKGQKRFLEHRVAHATLTLELRQPQSDVPMVGLGNPAKAKLYPGPRVSTLVLLDPQGRERVRLGGGVQVRLTPRVPIELDVFADEDGDGRAILATVGGVLYSDFLGRGRRRWLNPFLDFRVGYGHVGGHAFAFGAGAGVELFKHEYVLLEATTRILGLAGSDFETALVSGAAVVFAF